MLTWRVLEIELSAARKKIFTDGEALLIIEGDKTLRVVDER